MKHNNLAFAAVLLAGLLLGACGSGGDAEAPPAAQEATEVPASAMASTQALVDWTGAQAPTDIKEPLDVVKSMPPVSDTDEPASIR